MRPQWVKRFGVSVFFIFAGCSSQAPETGTDKAGGQSPFKAQTEALQQAKQVEQLLQDAARKRQQEIEQNVMER